VTSPAADLVLCYLDRLKLAPLLAEPAVEDLAIQEEGIAWVRQAGKWRRIEIPEINLQTLEDLAVVSGSLRRQEHGVHRPILDTELPGGERLHVNSFPTVPIGTISYTIRKHEDSVYPIEAIPLRYVTDGWNQYARRGKRDLDQLTALYHESDPTKIVGFLKACIRARLGILLVGATGSSKTALLKTLCSAMPPWSRICTVEDAKETTILHPNHVRMLFKRDDLAERAINSDILLQCTLRMHPDIVILGEVRGREAWTFVKDVVPPHPGSITCIHGHDPASGFTRMIALCKESPAAASYDDRALATLVAQAIDVIVPLEQIDGEFHFHPVWFAGEAAERKQTALELLEM
jgi:type IV secretion system protein VirB11